MTTVPRSIFIVHPSHFLTDHRANGDGLVAFGFLSELARRGHRIDAACEWSDIAGPLPDGLTLHPIVCRARVDLVKRVEYMFRVRSLMRRLSRTRAFDLAHQLNPVFAGLSLGLVGSRMPLVLGTYVARWPEGRRSFFSRVRTALLNAVSHVQQRRARVLLVTTRAALADRISPDPRVRSRVRFLNHGIDVSAFAPAVPNADRPFGRILLVAGLMERKGVHVLLAAFARVAANHPEARLTFVGGGGEIERLREKSRTLGLGARVEFRDDVPRASVPQIMRESDIYCLPSFGEPYATSVIEAMASGLPVIVSDSGGVGEIVDADGALVVRTGSVDSLADAIGTLVADPARARAMGRHNRERAEREYAWSAVGDALEACYAVALGETPVVHERSLA